MQGVQASAQYPPSTSEYSAYQSQAQVCAVRQALFASQESVAKIVSLHALTLNNMARGWHHMRLCSLIGVRAHQLLAWRVGGTSSK